MTKQFPHIETRALEKTLRECAKLLRAASDASLVHHDEIGAAAQDAERQADALATIKSQSHIGILGRDPFEISIGSFPVAEGFAVPIIAVKESTGERWALGFFKREAAALFAGAAMAVAIHGNFPETAPDGKAH